MKIRSRVLQKVNLPETIENQLIDMKIKFFFYIFFVCTEIALISQYNIGYNL